MKSMLRFALLALLLPASIAQAADTPTASNSKDVTESREKRLAWWREARFGMFIHWGLYSVLGGEFDGKKSKTPGEGIMREFKIPKADYAKHAKDFTCAHFNADQWVTLAKDAGMRYIVFTAKHTEGFAMFRSKASLFNICDATPFKRDPLKELADACRKQEMLLGFYYAQSCDTFNDGFGNNWDSREKTTDQYFDTVAIPQIRELLANYGEYPSILWWDAPDGMTAQRAGQIAELVRASKPDVIMDDRLNWGFPGEYHATWSAPRQAPNGDWELHGSMNFASWGYIKNSSNCSADAKQFVQLLVDAASKGGNFILNVTPDAEGRIPKAQIDTLGKIGQWKVNGEAVYGTTATPFGLEFGALDPEKKDKAGKPVFNPARDWRCTTKPGRLYIHIFTWPATGRFELPPIKKQIIAAYLLADPKRTELTVTQTQAAVSVDLPPKAPDPINSVLCLETK